MCKSHSDVVTYLMLSDAKVRCLQSTYPHGFFDFFVQVLHKNMFQGVLTSIYRLYVGLTSASMQPSQSQIAMTRCDVCNYATSVYL